MCTENEEKEIYFASYLVPANAVREFQGAARLQAVVMRAGYLRSALGGFKKVWSCMRLHGLVNVVRVGPHMGSGEDITHGMIGLGKEGCGYVDMCSVLLRERHPRRETYEHSDRCTISVLGRSAI